MTFISLTQANAAKLIFSDGHNLAKTLDKGLATAVRHADIITPELKSDSFQRLLLKTAKRSIKVRIITNRTPASVKQASILEKHHIDVRYAPIKIQYGFAVLDGARALDPSGRKARVITSSTGFSTSDLTGIHRSLAITVKGFPLAQNYQEEFNYVWIHSEDHGSKARYSRTSRVNMDNETRVVFSSESLVPVQIGSRMVLRSATNRQDSQFAAFLEMSFERAKKSIHIATDHFERGDLYRSLQRALRRGVKVTLILPASELQPSNKKRACKSLIMTSTYFDECLIDLGADVRYTLSDSTSPLINGHTIIVDQNYGFTGSFDFSWNSELKSLSNMLVIRGNSAHTALMKLKRLRNLNTEHIPGLSTQIIKSNGHGPCRFKPMTMRPKDLEILKNTWRKSACSGQFN